MILGIFASARKKIIVDNALREVSEFIMLEGEPLILR
jgi:hypothetical protein